METIIEIGGKKFKVINNTLCPGLEFVLETVLEGAEMKSITTHDMELELIEEPDISKNKTFTPSWERRKKK